MKLTHIATALGMSHLAAAGIAETTARGPYSAAFDQHCGNDQTQGTLTVDGKTFSYYCNVAQSTGSSHYIKLSTPERCIDVCDDDDDCDTAVWDRSQGQCWLGQGTGDRVPYAGRMVIAELDPLAKCEASLAKYKPGAPTCAASDRKIAEVDDTSFYLVCGQVPTTMTKQTGTFNSLEDCLRKCTTDSNCSFASFENKQLLCYHSAEDFVSSKPNNYADWETGVKIPR
ncbi:hypothetical protein P168DRAFT_278835 [Aspergillus campestris IBT 28561]|uniref:Apple domain-containing protein n=1 Tax=Aspergillus campestris (strain IBT 28561) TaxID=1392248 RepID=A0A2I1DHJ1_ASPC2|nr:uncharacterized protein P168DRAFT_278835 [Aspergillus campestris IBT 28561]PKY09342.1 hypothetical protein P168DRAFT_278835 [Aspergillus campestris IBT 28561]